MPCSARSSLALPLAAGLLAHLACAMVSPLPDSGPCSGRASAAPPAGIEPLAIDDYISQVDDSYRWSIVKETKGDVADTVVIKLTSQSWRAPHEVDRQEWEHWVVIARPKELKTDKFFLMVGGGGNDGDRPPDGPSTIVSTIANATGSVVVELKMIPNQPIVFHEDGTPRKEDDLIAYCWTNSSTLATPPGCPACRW